MNLKVKSFAVNSLTLGFLATVMAVSAQAVRFPDGRVAFSRPPRLVEATTLDHSSIGDKRFHFVIEISADAGEPLGTVAITPLDRAERIAFNLDGSEAQLSPAYTQGPMVPLASVSVADGSNNIQVVFDEPVQPGETVTVSLNTGQMLKAGVYQFEVTGYPAGDSGVGQYLGVGRINIFDSDN